MAMGISTDGAQVLGGKAACQQGRDLRQIVRRPALFSRVELPAYLGVFSA
jgi:hypothetical protein